MPNHQRLENRRVCSNEGGRRASRKGNWLVAHQDYLGPQLALTLTVGMAVSTGTASCVCSTMTRYT